MNKIFIVQRADIIRIWTTKTFRIMRLTYFIFFITVFNIFGSTTYSQYTKLNLDMKDVPIRSVLNEIEGQSEFFFLYSSKMIDVNQRVDIQAESKSVYEIMDELFEATDIKYAVKDRQILLVNKETEPAEILVQNKITGRVKDENGVPVPGANVTVKGTTVGTITDAGGNFSLVLPENAKFLVVSFVGYLPQEIPIGTTSAFSVNLIPDTQSLSEVVVVGYGSQKKSDLTGSISSVKGTDLLQLPSIRSDEALQGRAAGVVVTNNDGAPGGIATIRIRGGNSITGSNNALIVIDGFQGGDLSSLNPNEIESVEVLKDASATAIYGSKGANGVILVTTKRGKIGAPVVDYSYSIGFQSVVKKIDLLNGPEYARMQNIWKSTQNLYGEPVLPFTEAQITELEKTGGTDWQDELFRKAALQLHQISIKGGTDAIRYFVAGGYFDQDGLIVNTQFKRYTLRSNLDVDVNKWLKAGLNMNVIKDKGNIPPSGEGTRYVDILSQAVNSVLRFDPCTPVYDEFGNYSGPPSTYGDRDVWNPMATAMGSFNELSNMTTNLNAFLEFSILKGLTFKVTGAAGIYNSDRKTYYNSLTKNGRPVNGIGNLTDDKSVYYQNSNILTYDRIINTRHHLTLTGVAEMQSTVSYGSDFQAQGFASDLTGINDIGGASQINYRTSYDSRRNINSWLGRINYGYADKYLITLSYRADGSSVFGKNNKWGYFPSASLAWRASEENFIKNLNVFSDLKFRGSWGQTGNQAIAVYGSLAKIGSGLNYPYNGFSTTDIGYGITSAPNVNLKWETTTQTDLGVDMSFFKGRLTATVDVYKKKTTDLLLNRPVPFYTGAPSAQLLDNVGSVENKGIEITIGADPVTGSFRWNTSVNFTLNRSKVLKLVNSLPMGLRTNTGGGYQIYNATSNSLMYLREGEPMGQMRGYIVDGTWAESEREEALSYGQLPGDQKYRDMDKDGRITEAGDVTLIGNSLPDFVFGWNNSISYKNFTLSFLIQGCKGNDIFNATRIQIEAPSKGTSTALNDRWTIDNQDTDVPAFTDQLTRRDALLGIPSKVSLGRSPNRLSRYVEDGSYARLKNVTLGFDLPKSLIGKIGMTNLRTYIMAANLLTLTKYSGYDPEVSSFNVSTDAVRGIDLSNYPTVKTITIGINVTF
jgi:TonB-linked SusC/RagA family outer membrane protein